MDGVLLSLLTSLGKYFLNIRRYKKFLRLKYSFRILQTINRLNTWIKHSIIKQIQNTITEASEQRLNSSRQWKCRSTIGYCPRKAPRENRVILKQTYWYKWQLWLVYTTKQYTDTNCKWIPKSLTNKCSKDLSEDCKTLFITDGRLKLTSSLTNLSRVNLST